jgi:hypothetical protein
VAWWLNRGLPAVQGRRSAIGTYFLGIVPSVPKLKRERRRIIFLNKRRIIIERIIIEGKNLNTRGNNRAGIVARHRGGLAMRRHTYHDVPSQPQVLI